MKFQVPQYVDLEDKLAFKLTLKQLGWFGFGGLILFIMWNFFEKWVFWASFPFVSGFAIAFAFYKPAGLTLITFLIDGAKYFIWPKELIWNKGMENVDLFNNVPKIEKNTEKEEYIKKIKEKQKQIEEVNSLATILDEKSDL